MRPRRAGLCLCLLMASPLVAVETSATETLEGREPLPRIVLPEPTHDFGVRLRGHVFERVFEVRNEGDAPLLLERVKPC